MALDMCMETLRQKHKAEYDCYRHMKNRCNYKNHKRYHRYGGRNISICQRWQESFENFFNDMGPRPSFFHSIDRKNNNGNYEPGNCRWSTQKEQSRNRISNRNIFYNGKIQCLAAWVEELEIPRERIKYLLKKGWTMKEIQTEQQVQSVGVYTVVEIHA